MSKETTPTAGLQVETFYRVCHDITQQGLWYSTEGGFTGWIHGHLNFCTNNKLEMPFDAEIVGYLSATKTIDELLLWFPLEDIKRLEDFGFFITQYEATDYKLYKNHWVIKQDSSVASKIIPLVELTPEPLSEQNQEGETVEDAIQRIGNETYQSYGNKQYFEWRDFEDYFTLGAQWQSQATAKQINQYKARIGELESVFIRCEAYFRNSKQGAVEQEILRNLQQLNLTR